MLAQLPVGFLVNQLEGRKVLPFGVGLWSLATTLVPWCAGSSFALLTLSRAAVGLGEASAPSSATDIVGRSVPKEERARAMSFVFAGLQVGSILGYILAPEIIERLGWPAVFVVFGGVGLVWVAFWQGTKKIKK